MIPKKPAPGLTGGGHRFSDKIMPTDGSLVVSAAEAKALFSDLVTAPALVLAVSGGPDSTALMLLAARWRAARQHGPKLIAVTVDHGLRPEAKAEAAAVGRLARKLKIAHRILRWSGAKPKTGLQQAARQARYRLLARAARAAGAGAILTAHTLDDQAETVLIRMTRGSGVTGLAAMSRLSPLPGAPDIELVRPLLDIPKSRLIATLKAAKIPFAEDPSNHDPRFTRARLRELMPALAREGLNARRLSLLARRLQRADAAIEAMVAHAATELAIPAPPGTVAFDAAGFARLPAEVGLRLIGRALDRIGDEGPVQLGKLEALKTALNTAQTGKDAHFRRTLAGAIVTLLGNALIIERAPRRRGRTLTTRGRSKAGANKAR
jgi:tRNA(Ile)-lysidine synthase